jgi:phosphatidylglycerol:prolipoprotein diacylglycerol transferase
MKAKNFSSTPTAKQGSVARVPFPDFDPILLQIGPFAIRWYALAYIAGILLGWRYAAALVSRPGLAPARGPVATTAQIDDLILWITLGIIVGGRLGYILFYKPSTIWTAPAEIPMIWLGGMSFHGGALGVLIAILLFARQQKLDTLRLLDIVAAVQPIGQFFGRIANFINGELWGRPTDVPWGVIFPGAGPYPRHPSQLYEAALEGLALFLVLVWAVWGRGKLLDRRGVVAGIFMLGYGVSRSVLETVREPDDYLPIFPFGLTMGMMLSIPMIVVGAWLIWRGLREPRPDAPVQTATTRPADEPA